MNKIVHAKEHLIVCKKLLDESNDFFDFTGNNEVFKLAFVADSSQLKQGIADALKDFLHAWNTLEAGGVCYQKISLYAVYTLLCNTEILRDFLAKDKNERILYYSYGPGVDVSVIRSLGVEDEIQPLDEISNCIVEYVSAKEPEMFFWRQGIIPLQFYMEY